ncbi:MAG: hypothetical protein R2729_05865 [Bryobacteraceae bacterium]
MKEKTVVIEIDEQGNSSLDLEGFQGRGCTEVARDFRANDSAVNVRNKREFYLQTATARAQQERQ